MTTAHPSDRSSADRDDHRYAETALQKAALISEIVFLVVGLAGFIPGLTTNYSELSFAGHDSGALLLGIFQVSVLHNLVHLLYGVAGLAFARSRKGSRNFLIFGGIIYAVIWVYGLFFSGDHPANFVPVNSADNWLHLFLAVAMILLGIFLSPRMPRVDRPMARG
ncbi:DUF4383 domain-containing protein [Leifsonia sp. RAF41]|uniref:DUF4383 domain-containing protein n=1 Tax=Leifsonia sp. RAF41 TaxID=3233056 RepID=UPI003F94A578